MYVLDTNVVSELRKAAAGNADKNVVRWAAGISPSGFFLSVITIMELELGTLKSERRDPKQGAILRAWLETQILRTFLGRLLLVYAAVARVCARLHVPNPHGERDALIAATALVHNMTVATRNVADFTRTGVRVVNPWAS
jgi:predicted nucleic acid-binding protein